MEHVTADQWGVASALMEEARDMNESGHADGTEDITERATEIECDITEERRRAR